MPKSKIHRKKKQGSTIIIVHPKGEIPDMVMDRKERRKIMRKERGSTS
jgi:hypothetical protein